LHITAWNIQIHYVKFRQTPQLLGWTGEDDVTLREVCGNTVKYYG
jgi:sulfite reductase (ferredoxin)